MTGKPLYVEINMKHIGLPFVVQSFKQWDTIPKDAKVVFVNKDTVYCLIPYHGPIPTVITENVNQFPCRDEGMKVQVEEESDIGESQPAIIRCTIKECAFNERGENCKHQSPCISIVTEFNGQMNDVTGTCFEYKKQEK